MEGEPFTRIIEHESLEGLIIKSIRVFDKNAVGVDLTITPTDESYMAMHRYVPVVAIYD
jgi:hypothetical protein